MSHPGRRPDIYIYICPGPWALRSPPPPPRVGSPSLGSGGMVFYGFAMVSYGFLWFCCGFAMVSMVFYGFAMVSYGFLWVCKGFAIVMVLLWFCYGFYTFVKALVVFAIVLFWKDKTGKASKDIAKRVETKPGPACPQAPHPPKPGRNGREPSRVWPGPWPSPHPPLWLFPKVPSRPSPRTTPAPPQAPEPPPTTHHRGSPPSQA